MAPRVRLDFDHPTVECCDLLYEYRDKDLYCPDCGEMFDWDSYLECWPEEDYSDDMHPGDWMDDDEDEEEPPWWGDDMNDDKQIDMDTYLSGHLPLPLEYGDDYTGAATAPRKWKGSSARPPTAHLPRHHKPVPRKDPLLDPDIPDEIL